MSDATAIFITFRCAAFNRELAELWPESNIDTYANEVTVSFYSGRDYSGVSLVSALITVLNELPEDVEIAKIEAGDAGLLQDPYLLSMSHLARILGVSRQQLHSLRSRGVVPYGDHFDRKYSRIDAEEISKQIGQQSSLNSPLFEQRKLLCLTQSDVAEAIGASKSSVSRWETNGEVPEKWHAKLAAYLDIDPELL